jgi:hypothetical protein
MIKVHVIWRGLHGRPDFAHHRFELAENLLGRQFCWRVETLLRYRVGDVDHLSADGERPNLLGVVDGVDR